MKKYIHILALMCVVVSCSKDKSPSAGRTAMSFAVITPEVQTKAEVTSGSLDNVFIYGQMSSGNESGPVFDSPGIAKLIYIEDTKLWSPGKYSYGGIWSSGEYTWDTEAKMYYQFYGHAYSSNADVGTNLIIPSNLYGRQFTVTQPESIEWTAPVEVGGESDGSGTIDYLLSYLVNVPPAEHYPLVTLNLEHAMTKVEVDVRIANSMFSKDEDKVITGCLVKDINVELSGIRRKAEMLCLQPKLDGESGSNTWYISQDESVSTATYKVTDIDTTALNLSGAENGITTDMSFLAVPVKNNEMSDYRLVLTYNMGSANKKSPADYEYVFNLADYSPQGWVSGHRVKYVLTIDNSIHLTGTILDYDEVDYIEATLLPDIPATY